MKTHLPDRHIRCRASGTRSFWPHGRTGQVSGRESIRFYLTTGYLPFGPYEFDPHFGANALFVPLTKPSFGANRLGVAHFPKIGYFLDWEIGEFKKFS